MSCSRSVFGPAIIALFLGVGNLSACGKTMPEGTSVEPVPASQLSGASANAWMELVYESVRLEGQSPPLASRTYAYAGIMLYEATLGGMEGFRTLQDQLPGFGGLPLIDQKRPYDWNVVTAEAMGTLLPELFTHLATFEAVDALRKDHIQTRRDEANLPEAIVERSRLLGEDIALAALRWIEEDGYTHVHDLKFTPPTGEHVWVPTAPGQSPLMPHWSTLRPFALSSADACKPPPPVPFSTDPDSDFFQEALAVYDATMHLTPEQESIARFWADDPGLTGTPPGHWVRIAATIVDTLELPLDRTVEMYALLGIALADAFISCWDEKYRSYLVRPVTYIKAHIDPQWETVIDTPPFPEYTSGHSNVSGAAALILASLFGEMPFEDDLHREKGMAPRFFTSFGEAAREAAISRLYGGIHYPMGIDHGIDQGKCVGRNVLNKLRTRQAR